MDPFVNMTDEAMQTRMEALDESWESASNKGDVITAKALAKEHGRFMSEWLNRHPELLDVLRD